MANDAVSPITGSMFIVPNSEHGVILGEAYWLRTESFSRDGTIIDLRTKTPQQLSSSCWGFLHQSQVNSGARCLCRNCLYMFEPAPMVTAFFGRDSTACSDSPRVVDSVFPGTPTSVSESSIVSGSSSERITRKWCHSPKVDRGSARPYSRTVLSVNVVDQWIITEVNQHRVVPIVEPAAEDIETPVSRPG